MPHSPDVPDGAPSHARALAMASRGRPGALAAFVTGDRGPSVHPARILVTVVEEDRATAPRPSPNDDLRVRSVSLSHLTRLATHGSDADRRCIARATVVHDDDGVLARTIAQLRTLLDGVREDRMRVHYFELTRFAKRAHTAERRLKKDVVQLLTAEIVLAAARVLFLAKGEWPTSIPWVFDDLRDQGISSGLVDALEEVLASPGSRPLRRLRVPFDQELLGLGAVFLSDPESLWKWLFETAEGRAAMGRWGGEAVTR